MNVHLNECGKIFISAYILEYAKYESKKKFVLNLYK